MGESTGKPHEAARKLHAAGYWSHAIHPDKKSPIGKGWGLDRWSVEKIDETFRAFPAAGVGIALGPDRGPGGGWLIDAEVDGPQGEDSLDTLLGGERPDTPSWSSTRGDHTLFIVDGDRLQRLLTAAGAEEAKDAGGKGAWHLAELPGLELRTGGRKTDGSCKQIQSVCPPSVGTDGTPRAWKVTPRTRPAPLPEAAYLFIEGIAARKSPRKGGDVPAAGGSTHNPLDDDYIAKALKSECDAVEQETPGGRNNRLNVAAFSLGTLVGAGALPRGDVERALAESARRVGLGETETRETVKSGLDAGIAHPRDLSGVGSRSRTSVNGNGVQHSRIDATAATSPDIDEIEIEDRWPKIDPQAYHGLAGDLIELVDPHTEADPVAVLFQFLTAFGNMVGRTAHFRVGATHHYLNLYIALIGPTAIGRKGTSLDLILWLLSLADPVWCRERIQSGLVSGEGLIYHVRDQEWGEKECKDPVTKQIVRQTVLVDPGVSDKRLLVTETEMGRFLKAMNRDTNTLSDVLRQGWDTGNMRTLGKHSPVKATDAHVSLICHATQSDVRRHLTETDSANGFANRFLWPCSRRSKLLPSGGDLESVNWTSIQARLRAAAEFASCRDATGRGRRMTRDPLAAKAWHAIYEDLSAGKPGLIGKILSRAEAQVMRLACLYAVIDCSPMVAVPHLQAAIAAWEFCERSTRLVFGEGMGDPDAERLIDALKRNRDGLTRSQISTNVFKRNKKAEEIASLLTDLLTQGLIHRKTDQSNGGRRAERWCFGRGQ